MKQETKGKHLVAADRGFATGGGVLARLFGGGFRQILDRIDAGLVEGGIDATLPDGSRWILGGRKPGPMPVVHLRSWRALVRLISSGSVGWYKAWALGEWSSPDPVPLFDLFMRNGESLGEVARAKGIWRKLNRFAHLLRRNSKAKAKANIAFHYDLGNDFYSAWLDGSMTYSSAMFGEGMAGPLEEAQERKIRALLDRLDLQPGQRLLEIGCGWGSLAEIAARDYGVSVVGLTLSAEQKAYADARTARSALSDRVSIELVDYRDADGQFDAVASVEMVEAVGQDYWPAYLQTVARVLKPGGRAALQLISMKDELFDHYAASADFIQTYIFPGGMLISEPRFQAIAELAGLSWRDRKGFGLHYAETLKRWRERYDLAVAEGRLPAGFDERFHGLWRYYL
ncbi:MAG: cyclopropane-fatty-acyl-phospholipid synthase family protein, partial [Pseudomonadota bacterium]|nr:cyclopropane-fatty-acyl-phospholipid synthase family protein [Pseudomonadota bacterium]